MGHNGISSAPAWTLPQHGHNRCALIPHYPALPCSFVFGDGDPNEDFDRKRWQAVRAAVRLGCLNMLTEHGHRLPSSRLACGSAQAITSR